jgi:hypothetical protein
LINFDSYPAKTWILCGFACPSNAMLNVLTRFPFPDPITPFLQRLSDGLGEGSCIDRSESFVSLADSKNPSATSPSFDRAEGGFENIRFLH